MTYQTVLDVYTFCVYNWLWNSFSHKTRCLKTTTIYRKHLWHFFNRYLQVLLYYLTINIFYEVKFEHVILTWADIFLRNMNTNTRVIFVPWCWVFFSLLFRCQLAIWSVTFVVGIVTYLDSNSSIWVTHNVWIWNWIWFHIFYSCN